MADVVTPESQVNLVNIDLSFFAALSMIIVSEIGDKTFFIAAIMAMRHSRTTVFLSAISALAIMTLLSTGLGLSANIIPDYVVKYVSVCLFFIFGFKMLKDGYYMTDEEGKEEYEEVQKSLNDKENTTDIEYSVYGTAEDSETGVIRSIKPPSFSTKLKRRLMHVVSLVFIETFIMTFAAEWGDRSQITTIVLAARENFYGVLAGAILGHSICTGIAVLGGRFVAQKISVRTVTLVGGVVFIIFAFYALYELIS